MNRSKTDTHHITRRAMLGGATAAAVAVAAESAAQAAPDEGLSTRGNLSQEAIDEAAAAFDDDLIALRRDLHAHPDNPGDEKRTAAAVAERLRAAGLEVTTGVGGHGVVGVLKGRRPGRTVAYRADMDAVPAADQIGGDGTGPEHLCGHDVHTTVGVGVAQVLARLRHRLKGTVVFVFQPAEETLEGAQAMIDAGVLTWTRPEEIHALHCGPFAVGGFAVTPGMGMPGLDRGKLVLSGPDATERAELLADELAGIGTVAPPQTPEDLEQLVEDLGTPNGPLAEFVFFRAQAVESDAADRAEVAISYRCWPEERYLEVREEIDRIAGAYGEVAWDFPDEPFPALNCPEKEGNELKRHLRRVFGPESVAVMQAATPFNGEDFALFIDRLPGTYTFIGVRTPGAGIETSAPHFAAFEPDERAIGVGVRAMAGWLAERARKG